MEQLNHKLSRFIEKCEKVHNKKYNYSQVEYVNAHTKVQIICPEHGIFSQIPDSHSRGHGCSKCKGGVSKQKKDFISKAKQKHGDKYDYSKTTYINSYTKVGIVCPEHGFFLQRPNDHLKYGCMNCGFILRAKNKTLNNEHFILKAKKIHGDLYDYTEVSYINSSSKVKIKCNVHGIFEQRVNSHLNGSGCPLCRESYGEKIIRLFLAENKIKYIPQKRFSDCKDERVLPFDFYLPKLNLCIEYDGIQHFKMCFFNNKKDAFDKIKRHDKIKNEYCSRIDGPKLLRISYLDAKNINLILRASLRDILL